MQDAIFLNTKLFQRVDAIYKQRATLKLDPEALRLLEYYYDQFVHAGAKLSDADKAELKKLNEEESTLSNDLQHQAAGRNQGRSLRHHGQNRARRVL